jgi:branched-chain amino acid aminotransferase
LFKACRVYHGWSIAVKKIVVHLKAYNHYMADNTVKAWELAQGNGAVELNLPEMSSLDAITRQLPQGFYTTFRTFEGGKRVLGLRAHLRRLYQPATLRQVSPSISIDNLRNELADLLQAYPAEARVRIMMASDGQFFLALEPLEPLPPEIYSHGVKVISTTLERQDPRLKSTAFISSSRDARMKIMQAKVFEALLVRNGRILEGMTSNFFYVKEGKLGTARRDILLGVTRQTMLRVGRGSGLEIVYKPLKLGQIQALDEAFLTSSSRGIVPIVQIDEVAVGEGSPGVVTKDLFAAYKVYIKRFAENIRFDAIQR